MDSSRFGSTGNRHPGLSHFRSPGGQSIVSVMLNNMLGRYGGDIYISAYGVVNNLFDRVRKTLKLTLVYATAYTSVGFLLLFLMPRFFAGIFTTVVFPLIGIQIIGGSYFPVIGKPFPSLVLNILRQFLLLISLLLILPRFFGLSGLLISFPIADFLATIITVVWLLVRLTSGVPEDDG